MNDHRPSAARTARRSASWLTPTVVLLLVPKCPMCLAAYVAAATGASMSVAAAGWVRTVLIVISAGALAYLSASVVWRRWRGAAKGCACAGGAVGSE